MNYAQIDGTTVVRFDLNGDDIKAAFPEISFPVTIDQSVLPTGYVVVVGTDAPTGQFVTATEAAPIQVDGVWTQQWTTVTTDLTTAKAQLIDQLADYRNQQERGGTALNGSTIKTDPDSQAKVTGAKVFSDLNPGTTINWKTDDGSWILIDATTITAMAQAVGTHVQACFTQEFTLTNQINAVTTIADLEAIDITAGWPV